MSSKDCGVQYVGRGLPIDRKERAGKSYSLDVSSKNHIYIKKRPLTHAQAFVTIIVFYSNYKGVL